MPDPAPRYRFGGFVFDPRTGDLVDPDGAPARLAPKAARLLTLLLEARGRLVSREALQAALWPDTVVEYDQGLNFLVREVRTALGDAASEPRFIETLPRRGYRFVARIRVEAPGPPGGARRRRGEGRRSFAGSALVTAALAAGAAGAVALGGLASGPAEPGDRTAPDPRAREAAEMGGYLLTRGRSDDVERSVDFFREAVTLDPEYGRAYAGLGSAYLRLARVEEGKAALARSLALDPGQWAPRLTLALRALYVEYDRPTARRHFEGALGRAPGQVAVRHAYAWSRAVDGELAEAMEHMHAALEIDPVSPRVNGDVGRLFYLAGLHDRAVAHCRRTARLTPAALRPRDCEVQALAEGGDRRRARDAAAAAAADLGGGPTVVRSIRRGAPADGLDAYWRWAAAEITARAGRGEDSHVHAAAAWARLGESERVFAALDAAYAVRCPVLPQIGLDPALAVVRDDPRFRALLRRVGGAPSADGRRASTR